MKTEHQVEEQLQSLFARCPDLCGFAIREEQVYALASKRTRSQSGGDPLRPDHDMASC